MNSQPNRLQPPDSIDRPSLACSGYRGSRSAWQCMSCVMRALAWAPGSTKLPLTDSASARAADAGHPAPRLRVVDLLVHALTEYSNRKKGSNIRQKKRFANIRLIRFTLIRKFANTRVQIFYTKIHAITVKRVSFFRAAFQETTQLCHFTCWGIL